MQKQYNTLKSSLIFKKNTNFIGKSSAYCFYMELSMYGNFDIYISVPLNWKLYEFK